MPGAIASANEARGTRLNYVGPCSKSTIQRERYLQHDAPAVLHGPAAWMIMPVNGGAIGESELSVDDGQGRLRVHVTGFVALEQHTCSECDSKRTLGATKLRLGKVTWRICSLMLAM
jgi:hypothetical protein